MELALPKTINPLSATKFEPYQLAYVEENKESLNTKKSYEADLRIFAAWLQRQGLKAESLIEKDFVSFFMEIKEGRKISTLNRYRASLSQQYYNILNTKDMKVFFKALRNEKSSPFKPSKPLLRDDLIKIMEGIKSDKYRFLLILQYKGCSRISEVLNLRVKEVTYDDEGLKVYYKETKTNKEGITKGLKNNGFDLAGMFKKHVKTNKLSHDDKLFNLTRSGVLKWIKKNIGEEYSTHSLRSGSITQSIMDGKPMPKIMKSSGHKSATTLINHYYEPLNIFDNTSDVI
ncbi:hypothetical protein LCGC14_0924530 [marine sediment metagenome]|uniref:Tyr recombinase domain-containing protein n=1 Tax=marine sediment metagenome TaxID=412755 RepID=A0A0F9R8J7_9ZZZZ|nr:hypothetical protein [Methylophaga sp.]